MPLGRVRGDGVVRDVFYFEFNEEISTILYFFSVAPVLSWTFSLQSLHKVLLHSYSYASRSTKIKPPTESLDPTDSIMPSSIQMYKESSGA